jgi:hypothetical protein
MNKDSLKLKHCEYSVKEILFDLLSDINTDIKILFGIGVASFFWS